MRTPAPEDLYKNDWAWRWNYYNPSWLGRLTDLCYGVETIYNFETYIMEPIRRSQATRRQVITLIALEQYKRKHGLYPKKLFDLVPSYLPEVPLDPFADEDLPSHPRELSYRTTASRSNFTLYSIGCDRKDNGGQLSPSGCLDRDECDMNLNASVAFSIAETERDRTDPH